MTVKRIFLTIVLALFCMNITFHCGSGASPLSLEMDLPVPFHKQIYENFCGVACVQMWADLDGIQIPLLDIAGDIGIAPNDRGASPDELLCVIGTYTHSEGYLAIKDSDEPGAQGDLISSTIEGIKYCVPSIMPFTWGEHAVLIKGYEWREKGDGTPYAIRCYYHDPNNRPSQNISAYALGLNFSASFFRYWVLLGRPEFLINGTFGHDSFVIQGGTYYGGPSVYNPKNLDTGLPTN
jgi:hypothetical protein